jgi:hypothetical protein
MQQKDDRIGLDATHACNNAYLTMVYRNIAAAINAAFGAAFPATSIIRGIHWSIYR